MLFSWWSPEVPLLSQAQRLSGYLTLAGISSSSSVRDLEKKKVMSTCMSPEVDNKDLGILSAYGNVGTQLASSKLPYRDGRWL